MAWGEEAAVSPETMRRVRSQSVAARNLADMVREFIRRPTTRNREAMESALANFDEVSK